MVLKNDLNLLEDEGIITDENIKTNNNNKNHKIIGQENYKKRNICNNICILF